MNLQKSVEIQTDMTLTGWRYIWPLLLIMVLLGFCLFKAMWPFFVADNPWQDILYSLKRVYWSFWQSALFSPWFYIGVPLLLIMQVLWPVQRNVKNLGSSLRMDFLYLLIMIPFYAITVPLFFSFLGEVYEQYFSIINLSALVHHIPLLEIILGILVIDFLGWMHHLVRHKVPVFWDFHAIHHSQTKMNPFTNERVHPLDVLIARIIKYIPALFFEDAISVGFSYLVLHAFLDRLNHSNIRTNLGVFRYLLVTPQSHRVHHSKQKEHYDKNFGVTLSIWDYCFGTQVRDYSVYPKTGVPDQNFPLEQPSDLSIANCIHVWIKQFIYPFRVACHKAFY
ncbi:sterol desaturase family protein [Neptunomonas qingdaonensis]|uniref:Sterol desaturase/sphingolipid hydroxylase, fatty acid hydroxylase superfamily n=1 Tax=Neptunomonas qingdaonensis TaxID=1045558 RepID=A0A1I2UZX4_9GAMM|nr:sterol desaturase family protein [Neptunomonas qingdaonensis]SFG80526.1 Sterol desaturase/sphingolipid hydroxylase, fatty acid hydroxylase superfamily [Neptunomonas qingdaonensis]